MMRIRMVFFDEAPQSDKLFGVKQDSTMFKVRLNGSQEKDIVFYDKNFIYMDDSLIRKDKKNVLQFRIVEPDEKEVVRKNIISNIFRGIAFIFMSIFLPVSFMRFKGSTIRFTKLKIPYVEGYDYVLEVSPSRYRCRYEESLAATDPFSDPFNAEDSVVKSNADYAAIEDASENLAADEGVEAGDNQSVTDSIG